MNKRIIISLLLMTNTITYGMKRPRPNRLLNNNLNTAIVLFNTDIIPQITTALCSLHDYQPCDIGTDIRALSCAHRYFYNYYTEKPKQKIIDLCLSHNTNSSNKNIAHDLKFNTIHNKIERFTDIVSTREKNFSADDLHDPWYFTVTTVYNHNRYQQSDPSLLLYVAINHFNLKAAITILNHTQKLYCDYNLQENTLLTIARYRSTHQDECDETLTIIQGLLQKGILPDGRNENSYPTPTALIYLTEHQDEKAVQSLLEYNADPHLMRCNIFENKINAFTIEPKKGWLQRIIDKVKANKENL